MVALITCGAIGLLIIIMSVFLLSGRGAFLLAGLNTMSKSEKEKYDIPSLCKFMGKVLLVVGVLTLLVGIEYLYAFWWFWLIWGILFIGITVFAIIYVNTGNRFKKG